MMNAIKLSANQLALLKECANYSIMDDIVRSGYYRLGGHGVVPIRYHRNTMWKLKTLGLVERTGGYTATQKGREYLDSLNSGGAL